MQFNDVLNVLKNQWDWLDFEYLKKWAKELQVKESLEKLEDACAGNQNVMEPIIDAVKKYATLQEVCDVFRKVFGEYRDPGIY